MSKLLDWFPILALTAVEAVLVIGAVVAPTLLGVLGCLMGAVACISIGMHLIDSKDTTDKAWDKVGKRLTLGSWNSEKGVWEDER